MENSFNNNNYFYLFWDSDETRIMHSKSANVEIITDSEKDEIIEDLFESLLQEYQKRLEESMSKWVYFWQCWFIE